MLFIQHIGVFRNTGIFNTGFDFYVLICQENNIRIDTEYGHYGQKNRYYVETLMRRIAHFLQ